jgi:transposase
MEKIRKHIGENLKVDGWKKVANDLELPIGNVREWAKKLGIEGPPDARGAKPTELTKEQEEVVLTMYPEKSPWVISKETGLTGEVVLGFLKRRGLYQGFSRRAGVSVNKGFFHWSNDFAYVFGYMCADGSIGEYAKRGSGIRKNRLMPVSSITSKDEQILQDIGLRMGLKSKPKSHIRKMSQFTLKRAKYWRLVTSCRWVFDKWTEYGLKPRKSYVGIGVPNVPIEFARHFVRGFFDGDGSKSRDGYSVKFGCTDKVFIEWLRSVVIGVVGGNMPKISIADNKTMFFSFVVYAGRAKKMLEWMSPGQSDLRLERKWAA